MSTGNKKIGRSNKLQATKIKSSFTSSNLLPANLNLFSKDLFEKYKGRNSNNRSSYGIFKNKVPAFGIKTDDEIQLPKLPNDHVQNTAPLNFEQLSKNGSVVTKNSKYS